MIARLRILRLGAARVPLLLARAASGRALLLRAARGGIPAAAAPASVVSSSRACALGPARVVATGLLLDGRNAFAFFPHPRARLADLLVALGIQRVLGLRQVAVVAGLEPPLMEVLRAALLTVGGLELAAALALPEW